MRSALEGKRCSDSTFPLVLQVEMGTDPARSDGKWHLLNFGGSVGKTALVGRGKGSDRRRNVDAGCYDERGDAAVRFIAKTYTFAPETGAKVSAGRD